MAQQALNGVLHHLRMAAAVQTYQHLPDRELLERFINGHEEAAFTVLIERHGPMVLRVCRRTLGNFHDAEDACQATFLVLARKAASVRKKTSISSWLHGVAYRVAISLKRDNARRRNGEGAVERSASKNPAGEVTWREMQTILDQELQLLPERYRIPLILCYLECMTRDEAAQHLGLSTTTFRGRLERARELLRRHLSQRGVTLAAALSASAVSEGLAKTTLTPTFVILSTKAAMLLAEGHPLTDGVIAAKIITLTQETLKSMLLTKLKLGTAIVVCAGLFVAMFNGFFTSLSIAQDNEPAPLIKKTSAQQDAESDKDFIRRISKEVRGIEPTPAEIHFFLTSKDPSKRQRLTDLFMQEQKEIVTYSKVTRYVVPQDSKDGFFATIKKVEGNKVTINRSDSDNKFKDQVLIASDKVKVTETVKIITDDGNGNFEGRFEQVEIKDGLKNSIFDKEVRARITVDKKNNITEIHIGGRFITLPDIDKTAIEVPPPQIEKP